MNFGWNCSGWKAFRIFVARLRRVCKECLLANIVSELHRGHLPSVQQHVDANLSACRRHLVQVAPFIPFWEGIESELVEKWQDTVSRWHQSLLEAEKKLELIKENALSNGDALVCSDPVEVVMQQVHDALQSAMENLVELHTALKEDERGANSLPGEIRNSWDLGLLGDLEQ